MLVGHPVAHSLSPIFQNAALRYHGLPLRYDTVDIPPAGLADAVRRFVRHRAAGNVTIPHKEAMASLCARLTAVAERTGAVNTFRVSDAGELEGTNTDVGGFDVLAREAGALRPNARVALLGAGGGAAAVLTALERWPGVQVAVYNRDRGRAERLAERYAIVRSVASDPASAAREATVVVNATPLGIRDGDPLPLAMDDMPPGAAVIDLVYRRDETAWVRAARARGHPAVDGLVMLLEQGALAFEWWFEIAAPRDIMRESLRQALPGSQ